MKICETYAELILKKLSGEITPEETRELEAHLESCEACRSLYVSYLDIDLAIAETTEPPAALKDAVMASIRTEKQQRNPLHMLKRFRFTAIAAVAAVIVLAVGHFMPSPLSGGTGTVTADAVTDETLAAADAEACEPETAEENAKTLEETAQLMPAYDGGGAKEDVYLMLSEAGYSGQLVMVYGASATELEAMFPNSEKMELSGYVVYALDSTAFSTHASELSSYEELLLPGDDTGDVYICIQE